MKTGIKYFLTGMILGLPFAGAIINNGDDKKNNSGLENKVVSQGIVEKGLDKQGKSYETNFIKTAECTAKNVAEKYADEKFKKSVEKYYNEPVQNKNCLEAGVVGLYSLTNAQEPKSKKIIVLDPGHGMGNRTKGVYDPGAVFGDYHEADIVLTQANNIKQILEKIGYKVLLTRENNKEECPIESRAFKYPNADLFLSLHCNSFDKQSAYGQEIFYNSEQSKEFAKIVQSSLLEQIQKTGHKTKNREIKQKKYKLLSNPNIPSVLVESGFLSNPEDRIFLVDNNPDVETGIVKGIDEYFKQNLLNIADKKNDK
jgi:N-acetylmuramoyl-L-alanine amidase